MTDIIENLEKMLGQGRDTALLRFGLGNEYLKQDRPEQAVEHLRKAVELDASYSAAWKLLGKALTATGDNAGAMAAYASGIAAAEEKGDKQAVKEMQVFRRRLEKSG
jgi:predicted Zn-dependent protease